MRLESAIIRPPPERPGTEPAAAELRHLRRGLPLGLGEVQPGIVLIKYSYWEFSEFWTSQIVIF